MAEEIDKVKAARQCNFLLLFTLSTAAWIMTMYSTAHCAYVARNVHIKDGTDVETVCAEYEPTWTVEECKSVLNNHGIGFWTYQITVPVDTLVCYSYTRVVNGKYVTPYFDTKFNSAQAFSVTASFFGALAWFTLAFASCCPIPPSRMKCISVYFLFAGFFQAMTLIIMRSNACQKGFFNVYFPDAIQAGADDIIDSVDCSLSTGSSLAVAASVVYFFAACLCPAADPPQAQGMFGQQGAQQEGGGNSGGEEAPQNEEA